MDTEYHNLFDLANSYQSLDELDRVVRQFYELIWFFYSSHILQAANKGFGLKTKRYWLIPKRLDNLFYLRLSKSYAPTHLTYLQIRITYFPKRSRGVDFYA